MRTDLRWAGDDINRIRAFAQELVGLHGGTISADSVEGAGTTFTIRLDTAARVVSRA